MPLEREDMRRAYLQKGFVEGPGDHDRFFLFVNGKRTAINTKLSRGSGYRTYTDRLLSDVCRQLKLTKAELLKLVECSIGGDEYVRLLRERGIEFR